MTILVSLPPPIEENLRRAARIQSISPENLAAQILEDAFTDETFETPEQVVERIKRLPPDPSNIRPATVSLKELLENSPIDPEFDVAEWQRQWDQIEQEMKAISRANREAEGLDF